MLRVEEGGHRSAGASPHGPKKRCKLFPVFRDLAPVARGTGGSRGTQRGSQQVFVPLVSQGSARGRRRGRVLGRQCRPNRESIVKGAESRSKSRSFHIHAEEEPPRS